MSILVLHAPSWRAESENARTFRKTVELGIGDGYAIASTELPLIKPGCEVWVLDKGTQRRAQGILVKLVQDGCTNSGILRYNVHMANLTPVSYQDVKLNRRGIAIL